MSDSIQGFGSSLPLWSQEGIDDMRRKAPTMHYPASKTWLIQVESLEATRRAHIAATAGDVKAEVVARLEILDATERIAEEHGRAADTCLSLLAQAHALRRHELDHLARLILPEVFARLDAIEAILAKGARR